MNGAGASSGDRFAAMPVGRARIVLLTFLAFAILAALAPQRAERNKLTTRPSVGAVFQKGPEKPRDEDLKLYDVAIKRIAQGENYYDFIAEEHRRADYPLRPAVAVRLPTLAYISATIGPAGLMACSFVLIGLTLLAWWRRLAVEPGGAERRLMAMAWLGFGVSLGTMRYFFALHELWAGMLLALAFGLHRPGKWLGSLAVAALALAIREHSLPFVLLMAAMAAWRRDWREAGAWTLLVLVFLGALAWHFHLVEQTLRPTDGHSAPWLVLRGMTGWMSNVALASNLRFLPSWLAGLVIVAAVIGWIGWRSAAGVFGALFHLGYGLLFMLAGRGDNWYWGFVVTPTLFVGLAFAPMALRSLLRSLLRSGRGPSISAA